jgi:hypothetical protein
LEIIADRITLLEAKSSVISSKPANPASAVAALNEFALRNGIVKFWLLPTTQIRQTPLKRLRYAIDLNKQFVAER